MDYNFKKVPEATYLTTEKSDKYRAILRFFYRQHALLKESLTPEEVLSYLVKIPQFESYSIDELKSDLSSLTTWGNLRAQQDSGRVNSIEDFQNKRFRYTITPYTVEFERMLVRFESDSENFSGSLEKNQFDRFEQILISIKGFFSENNLKNKADDAHQIWEDLKTYFKKITENTSDYFAYLRSENANEHMQSDAFLVYKDRFTSYLRDFTKALYRCVASIQSIMNNLSNSHMSRFFEAVGQHELTIFRFEEIILEDVIKESLMTWDNIKSWFIDDINGDSQYNNVLKQTNEAIRRLTAIVSRLGERNRRGISRKDDYLHLASWFLNTENIDDAHKLSSVVFGVSHTKHIYSDYDSSDDIYIDAWEEEPMDYGRNYRDSTKRVAVRASAMIDNNAEKEAYRQQYLKMQQEEQEIIESYRTGNEIIVENLPIVEPFIRKLFLSWIGKAMVSKDGIIKTEYGDEVKVILDQNRQISLIAKDGHMTMPAVIFKFKNEVQ